MKGPLSPSSEVEIVRKAYSTKVEHAKGLEKLLADSQASLKEAFQRISELELQRDPFGNLSMLANDSLQSLTVRSDASDGEWPLGTSDDDDNSTVTESSSSSTRTTSSSESSSSSGSIITEGTNASTSGDGEKVRH